MVATYETAIKLLYAGFSQPEFADGQRWYNDSVNPENIIAIIKEFEDVVFGCSRSAIIYGPNVLAEKALVFAPTVEDILRQIPSWELSFNWYDEVWVCSFDPQRYHQHAYAVEACAAAWFDQKANGVV
jgi:hypothetical protein